MVVKVRNAHNSDPDPNIVLLNADPKGGFERCLKGLRTQLTFDIDDLGHYDQAAPHFDTTLLAPGTIGSNR